MTPEKWRQVKDLLALVLEQPPKDREAYLLRVCAEPALRGEVESLIAAYDDSATNLFAATLSSTRPAPSLQPGALLGPYRIDARIGAGGMGEVFRATDTRLYRTVALKLLAHGQTSDPAHGQRLLQEARAASALNHANIVAVHDISNHEGKDFLVMEYIEGRTLKELMSAKAMPLSEVLEFAAQFVRRWAPRTRPASFIATSSRRT